MAGNTPEEKVYTVSMVTILTTTKLDIIKERFADLVETFEDSPDLNIEDVIGKGDILMQTTTDEDAQVHTHLRIDREEPPVEET